MRRVTLRPPVSPPPSRHTILFRINYWEFPGGVTDAETKERLADDYFNKKELKETEDWMFCKAYTAPNKHKPHLAVYEISDKFMSKLSKKQHDYAAATGISMQDHVMSPYVWELC